VITETILKIAVMATKTIEYNKIPNRRISSFKVALLETKIMSRNIAQNGIQGYKTLDDLLNED